MCFPISQQEAVRGDSIFLSFTEYLVAELTEYRNRPALEARGITPEMIERRMLGQLGYIALLVMAVVEAILRPVLGAVIVLSSVCASLLLGETGPLDGIGIGIGVALLSVYQVDVGLRCLVALVKNIYRDRMQYQDLRLAVFEICD